MQVKSTSGSAARVCFMLALAAFPGKNAVAGDPKESDFYTISTLPIPEGVVLEAGATTLLPDRTLAVSSRRGDVYLVHGAFDDPAKATFEKFAGGLHEVLGLAYRDGWLYATQRGELTRLKDEDGDGRADLFETVNDQWGVTGDYHEYAFGSEFDKNGDLWIVLCLTGSFSSQTKYRGWCVRINSQGELVPTCSGIRSPGGIGFNANGDCFYTDNQGPWNGACALKHLKPGGFMGHPGGNKWYDVTDALGPKPIEPQSGSRMAKELHRIPQLVPPAIVFPYTKMGKSAAGVACDLSNGKFGPFQKQLFVADQSASTVMRVSLELVNGVYQGVCFPFLQGFASGSLSVYLTKDGHMFVGGTNRGWGSVGRKPFALERVNWTGKAPFEIHEMRARPHGFELTFTKPVDPAAVESVKSYSMITYTHIYQASYGSPEVDQTTPKIVKAQIGENNRSVTLTLDKLVEGHVHELHAPGVRSVDGVPLLHSQAYYTLNRIPSQ